MIDIKLDHPISELTLKHVLSNTSLRNHFINNYVFFQIDGHNSVYVNFINSVTIGSENSQIDDAIMLADNINYCSDSLLRLIQDVLYSRKNFYLKLTCLDYLLSQHKIIDTNIYESLNIKFINNRNELLRLQSNVNMLLTYYNASSQINIIKILKNTSYPTVFFRFLNSVSISIETLKNSIPIAMLFNIIAIGQSHTFSNKVFNEIKKSTQTLILRLGG